MDSYSAKGDKFRHLFRLPGTDIDYSIDGPKGHVLIETKWTYADANIPQFINHHHLVKKITGSPIYFIYVRYPENPDDKTCDYAYLNPCRMNYDDLKWMPTTKDNFRQMVLELVGRD